MIGTIAATTKGEMRGMTRTMARIAGGMVALGLCATAAFAGPEGSYKVEGKAPDGSTYSGSATVVATGQTFKVTWVIGGDKYVGTAVGNDDFFAVTYGTGGSNGLAVYGRKDQDWVGIWTTSGDTKVGAERLVRK